MGWAACPPTPPREAVKPLALMQWLVRLVTPPGGVVLDPFAGSGSTVVAALREPGGYRAIGIEREPDFALMARARVAYDQGPKGEACRRVEDYPAPCAWLAAVRVALPECPEPVFSLEDDGAEVLKWEGPDRVFVVRFVGGGQSWMARTLGANTRTKGSGTGVEIDRCVLDFLREINKPAPTKGDGPKQRGLFDE